MGGAISIFALAAASCALTSTDEVTLGEREIRLRDVVTLDCVEAPRRDELGALVIALPPAGRMRVELDGEAIATLVRRRVPTVGRIDGDMRRRIVFQPPPSPARAEAACAETRRAMADGEPITRRDLTPTPCRANTTAPLAYDPVHAVLRAAAPLPEGAYLGRAFAPASAAVTEGAPLSLVVQAGAVRIERQAHAAQAALAGERIFIRTDDGIVISVDFPAAAAHD